MENRIRALLEVENFYRVNSMTEQTRDSLIDKILFQLTKFDPSKYGPQDFELISTYIRLLVMINKMTLDVVAEFIYWYLDGGERIR